MIGEAGDLGGAANTPDPRVCVIAGTADRVAADELTTVLRDHGVDVTDDPDTDAADDEGGPTAVILLSRAAVADPEWLRRFRARVGERLVPVRLEDVRGGNVPEELRPINWLYLDRRDPAKTWASVVAVVTSNAALQYTVERLIQAAEAWAESGYEADQLIDDRRAASSAEEVIGVLRQDALLRPNDLTRLYVDRSVAYTRRKRRGRVLRVVGAGVALVLIALAFVSFLTFLRESQRLNVSAARLHADDMGHPAWRAVNAVALLRNGDPLEQSLARQVLTDALAKPWGQGSVAVGEQDNVIAMKPLAGTGHVAVVVALGPDARNGCVFAVYDMAAGRYLWSTTLDRVYGLIDVSSDGSLAALGGVGGIATIDLETQRLRALAGDDTQPTHLRLTRAGDVVYATADRAIYRRPVDTGGDPVRVAAETTVLDLRATSDGQVRALVSGARGRYALIDAASGTTLAEVTLADSAIPAGAVAIDAVEATVVAGDQQLWVLRPGEPAIPTGVAVPDGTLVLASLGQHRYVLDGQWVFTHVVFIDPDLGTGIDLGNICTQMPPRLVWLEPSTDGSTVACLGFWRNEVWESPAGPIDTASIDSGSGADQPRSRVRLEERSNGEMRLVGDHGPASTWAKVLPGAITASAVAEDGARALVASSHGEVAIVGVTAWSGGDLTILARWHVPDGARVVAATWEPTPRITTEAGRTWAVPDCRCLEDSQLVALVRERMTRCWSESQLDGIDDDTRRTLDLRLCPPPPTADS